MHKRLPVPALVRRSVPTTRHGFLSIAWINRVEARVSLFTKSRSSFYLDVLGRVLNARVEKEALYAENVGSNHSYDHAKR